MSASGNAGRMDATPMKQVSGWDTADEAARLKASMMSREKMVSLLFLLYGCFCFCLQCLMLLVGRQEGHLACKN